MEPLLKTGLPLIGTVLKPLAKSNLIPLELTAAAAARDAVIDKKMFGSGNTTLIISNEEMNDIMKIIKSLEESGLLIKVVSESINNEAKEQKGGFLKMLLGTLAASLLGNLFTGKGSIATSQCQLEQVIALLEQIRIFNATSSFNKFWNRKILNGVYSRNNLPKIKDGA